MRSLLCVFAAVFLFATLPVSAQSQPPATCPAGQVCVSQETANRLFNVASQLVEAKDVIAKMLAEREASDAAIASALKTIEGWQNLDAINNTIIAKQKDVIVLYERTITLYAGLVDGLEKRLSKPKSAWSRFVDILKNAAILLAGIQLGRGV
jgi:hypothetical protein